MLTKEKDLSIATPEQDYTNELIAKFLGELGSLSDGVMSVNELTPYLQIIHMDYEKLHSFNSLDEIVSLKVKYTDLIEKIDKVGLMVLDEL